MKFAAFILIVICIAAIIPSGAIRAQETELYPRLGIQLHPVMPATEFYESQGLKNSYNAGGTITFLLSRVVKGEINGGFVHFAGLDYNHRYYRTNVYPLDFRALIYPFRAKAVQPFIYGGIGGLFYRVVLKPSSISPVDVKQDGFGAYVPLGAGFDIPLSKSASFIISGGYNYSLNDHLNYYKFVNDKIYNSDAWASAGIGFKFALSRGDADDDNDGLTNAMEEKLGTDPENPDTDGDGLTDGEEVKTYHTNPLNADTDGDGLKDGDEVKIHHTDPLKADTDGDGIKDGDEVLKYHTDPLVSDTDGDKLSDGDEVNVYHTDPLIKDTDGDGLDDGEEILTYKTNPLNRDTDGGTVDDGTEVRRGTDPLNPADDVIKKDVPIILEGITFASAKADILPSSEETLQKALTTLRTHPEITVEIGGHTDIIGSYASNIKLSQRRADAVKQWLVFKGIDQSRIVTKGYGPDKPIGSNKTKEGRQLNRRIEFMRIK